MATMVCMPAVSANAPDAVLVEWTVREGDTVRAGDSLGGIETDKAVVDLEAEHDGVIGRLLVAAGTRVAVGAPVAVLLRQGETPQDVAEAASRAEAAADGRGAGGSSAEPLETGRLDGGGVRGAAAPSRGAPTDSAATADRIVASPVARRLAADAGLALADLSGSGPGGRIIKRDVEQALLGGAQPHPRPATAGSLDRRTDDASSRPSAYDELPHGSMRRAIARRLSESKRTIPHFYLRGLCRADALLGLRDQLKAVVPGRVSINDLVVRAAACALRDVPEMNVTWTEDALRRYRHADISVAVATRNGLVTPIVRGADRLGVPAISSAMAALIERARAGGLRPDEYEGGSFGISNLGMAGVSDFAAIINPPQSAMLAVGAIGREAVVEDDTIRVASVMRYTLAVDHRAIDGELAARWLARFTWYLEHPVAMLV
ncbi:Acetyltransferase component of pyruvate dehydrogenase complex [Bordetella sputigena]|uniref:2-oxo acid dehydrogenase subunit E2 n=1 Tax=Bordetella sputigena TaxID=1416810 RepID=UPI0039EF6D89